MSIPAEVDPEDAEVAAHVKRVVADWPELTSEQLGNVGALLRRVDQAPTT